MALNNKEGLTSEELEENWFELKLKSSRASNFPMSSGKVTRLLACRSSIRSFLILYKDLILAGVIELYERLRTSSFSKSSDPSYGIILI